MSMQRQYLADKYRLIAKLLGLLLLGLAAAQLVPVVYAAVCGERGIVYWAFGVSMAAAAAAGLLLYRLGQRESAHPLTIKDGAILVVLSWGSAILFSAIPFLFYGFTVVQSVFESTSGWTTTGLSVVDVLAVPRSLLLWRSWMQFLGGAGLAIVMLTALVGPYGAGFYVAEGRSDPLLPHIKRSVRLTLTLYVGYLVVSTLLYVVLGMGVFDAVNHAMAALSTGGFSTRPESIAAFSSFPIELATIGMMLIGSTNFAVGYQLVKGRVRNFARNIEVKTVAILLVVFVPLVGYVGLRPLLGSSLRALRVSLFELSSALTTTGFSTVSYGNWPSVAVFSMVVLMLIGGGINSTAGGLKQHRAYLLVQNILWSISAGIRPSRVVHEHSIWRVDRHQHVSSSELTDVSLFASLYFLTYTVGVFALLLLGVDLRDALFEFASSLATVGLTIGITGPATAPGILVVETIGMFLGRLELIVIFVGLGKMVIDLRDVLHRRRLAPVQ